MSENELKQRIADLQAENERLRNNSPSVFKDEREVHAAIVAMWQAARGTSDYPTPAGITQWVDELAARAERAEAERDRLRLMCNRAERLCIEVCCHNYEEGQKVFGDREDAGQLLKDLTAQNPGQPLLDELEQLRESVANSQTTSDDVVVTPGMKVYGPKSPYDATIIEYIVGPYEKWSERAWAKFCQARAFSRSGACREAFMCYSTEQAAREAGKGE